MDVNIVLNPGLCRACRPMLFAGLALSIITLCSATSFAADGSIEEERSGSLTSQASRTVGSVKSGITQGTRDTEFVAGYRLVTEETASHHFAGGFNITTEAFQGTQLAGGFNVAGRSFRGTQASAVFNLTDEDLRGLQVAGVFNTSGAAVSGVQTAGGLNHSRGGLRGAQIGGVLNVASGDVTGLQLAPFNVARGHVRGTQLGVFNAAPSADVGIGLFNIYWDGVLEAEIFGSDEGLAMVGIRHGGNTVYNVYHVGTRYTAEPEMPLAYGMGLGGRTSLGNSAEFSLDATATSILGGTRDWTWKDQINLFKLRPMVSIDLADTLSIFGGPTATFMVAPRPADADDYAHFRTRQFTVSDDEVELAIWPGFTFGGRFF